MIVNKDIIKSFGKQIKELRKLKKLSQEELAEKADLHRTYVGMIERGEKNITLLNILKISNSLEVEIHEIFKSIYDSKK